MMDDDEVRALENRLRTGGWADAPQKPSPRLTRAERKVKSKLNRIGQPEQPKPAKFSGFGQLDTKVTSIAKRMVHEGHLFLVADYGGIKDAYGVSYDDAVRVVAEARRILRSRGK